MRILDICPMLPYPPDSGGLRGIYYPLKLLAARGHAIHLVCLVENVDPESVRELAKIFPVETFASDRKPTFAGALASLAGRTAYQVSRFHNSYLLQHCRNLLHASRFDILQVEGIHAAYYALHLGAEFGIPTVMRVHNLLSLQMARTITHTSDPFMKLWLLFDVRRVRAHEIEASLRIDANLVISNKELDKLHRVAPAARYEVVPAGVDLTEFSPPSSDGEPHTMLWVGAFNHAPNVDSFWWFYKHILPRVLSNYPRARLLVAGKGTPDEIVALRQPNVEVLGYVPDIRDAMARAQVCVVPLRIGSGVRIKLLEMFAMGRSVVSTSVGAEGLGVTHDKQLLIADTPDQFAQEVVGLLLDPALRRRLGAEARAHVTRQFSWERVADQFESVYRSLLRQAN